MKLPENSERSEARLALARARGAMRRIMHESQCLVSQPENKRSLRNLIRLAWDVMTAEIAHVEQALPSKAVSIQERNRVAAIVAYAKKKGTLIPRPCERCGKEKVVAHHEDYGKPLEVTWLCYRHHMERHNELGWGSPNTVRHKKRLALWN